MKLNLLVATSQLNSRIGNVLGTGTSEGLSSLAELMVKSGIQGDIYDLPNGAQNPETASPFSLISGFALKTDEISFQSIPELKEDPGLKKHIDKISATHAHYFSRKRRVNYALKRSVMPWILEACYLNFQSRQDEHRQNRFEAFQAAAHYWLDDYALYECYKESGIDLASAHYQQKNSPEFRRFAEKAKERIRFYKYQQFLCFEQKQAVRRQINQRGIRLIVNLPFGVEVRSADVYFHPEVFDVSRQVGCSPEPEHGYPEQAWGIAAYREKTDGLKVYLEEKMKWLKLLGDGIFLDHMVGWCGQYILPMQVPAESTYPHGQFLTTDHEERRHNMHWFLDIVLQTGLKIRGEIAGDHLRVQATVEAVKEKSDSGHEIGAMVIPRWETEASRFVPLGSYDPATLTMVETHDTSTLLQYLLNRKGYEEDFESPEKILSFCRRVLGLPFFKDDVPLSLDSCHSSFWFEICRRFTQGTPSKELVFTLPGLLSLLNRTYRSASIENNINIKPGTSGAVGNGWGNWSYFSPPVEIMTEDPSTLKSLQALGTRSFAPFDYFHKLDTTETGQDTLIVFHSAIGEREVIYRDLNKGWCVWNSPPEHAARKFERELIIQNEGETELWTRIDISGLVDLDVDSRYLFVDLNEHQAVYWYDARDLKSNRLFVRLDPGQVHHFLVARET